jgi:SpoVK/Ycf46/Vps4 family AAA+-type ATPase
MLSGSLGLAGQSDVFVTGTNDAPDLLRPALRRGASAERVRPKISTMGG